MAQLLDMPTEILDLIFENTSLDEIWSFQQCSILCERALDTHMLARQDAVAELMFWGCRKGIPWAVKKALSHGADVDFITRPHHRRPLRYPTIIAAICHLDTVGLLLDLGARLDLDDDKERGRLRRFILNPHHPKVLQVVLDRRGKNQIKNFQTGLDQCLFNSLNKKVDFGERWPERWAEQTYEKCQAWLAYGANPARLLEDHTETAIERAISNHKAGLDPGMTIALVNLLLSATTEPQSPAVEVYRRQAE